MLDAQKILDLIFDYKEFAQSAAQVFGASFVLFLGGLRSSYKKHNYWVKFYNWVLNKKPDLIVEMGILDGYSLLSFAKGCVENKKGKIIAIDMFEEYPYACASYEDIREKLERFGMEKHVYLHRGDVMNLNIEFVDKSIDIMHIDISNTGDKIEYLLKKYHSKLKDDGVILFEGGSKSRDNIPWMINYNCKPIAPVLETPELKKLYNFFVIENYPSLTMCYKNHEQP